MIPQLRKSFTLKTLLMTSLPKLSNTKTFQIGSPSEFSIGVDFEAIPFEAAPSFARSEESG